MPAPVVKNPTVAPYEHVSFKYRYEFLDIETTAPVWYANALLWRGLAEIHDGNFVPTKEGRELCETNA